MPARTARRRAARRTASRSRPNTSFSVARFQVSRSGQTPPSVVRGRGGSSARTAISRVTVLHSPVARSLASFACQVPAAGEQPRRTRNKAARLAASRDLATTLPSGAISDSSPSNGFSAANNDAQRRALPRRKRRRQDRDLGAPRRRRAGFGLRVRRPRTEDEKCTRDQQRCGRSSSKPACCKQWNPLPWRTATLSRKLWLNHGNSPQADAQSAVWAVP